jgi:hypothetical protein
VFTVRGFTASYIPGVLLPYSLVTLSSLPVPPDAQPAKDGTEVRLRRALESAQRRYEDCATAWHKVADRARRDVNIVALPEFEESFHRYREAIKAYEAALKAFTDYVMPRE